jgi:hypothetical protein
MRELMVPVALKFPVGFVRKNAKVRSVSDVVAFSAAYASCLMWLWLRKAREEMNHNNIIKAKLKAYEKEQQYRQELPLCAIMRTSIERLLQAIFLSSIGLAACGYS